MNIQGFERGFFCHYSLFFELDVLHNLHGNLKQKRILTYPTDMSMRGILMGTLGGDPLGWLGGPYKGHWGGLVLICLNEFV